MIIKHLKSTKHTKEQRKPTRLTQLKLNRHYEEAETTNNKLEAPKELLQQQSYTSFVKQLVKTVEDPKAKAWIDYAFGGDSKDIKFTAEAEKGYAVKELKPTQNFIGLENSIGWTINNPEKAADGLKKMLLEKSPEMKVGQAIWIFNDEYIIDGHHRWSQVYAFNPDAKIVAINFKSSERLKPQQALAAVQGVIASVTGRVPVATSRVDGKNKTAANVLKDSEDTMLRAAQECLDDSPVKQAFANLCAEIMQSKQAEDREIGSIRSGFDGDSSDAAKVLTYAVRNCLKLKSSNNAVDGAPDREYMPQTDGGEVASKSTSAQVQQQLTSGVDDVVKSVERYHFPYTIKKRYR